MYVGKGGAYGPSITKWLVQRWMIVIPRWTTVRNVRLSLPWIICQQRSNFGPTVCSSEFCSDMLQIRGSSVPYHLTTISQPLLNPTISQSLPSPAIFQSLANPSIFQRFLETSNDETTICSTWNYIICNYLIFP